MAPCSQVAELNSPVVVKADQVGHFPIQRYRAWHFTSDGQWRPSTLQIDEINNKGEFVLKKGAPFTAYSDDGILDANDEIVLLGSELGRSFQVRDLPKEILADIEAAWRLDICEGTNRYGSVLLTVTKKNSVNELPNAVKFDADQQTIETDQYKYSFNSEHPILLGKLAFKQKGQEIPLIDDAWFNFVLRTPWWAPNIFLTDQNFRSTIECWQEGPIRTIIAVGVKFRQFLSLLNIHMFSELIFYQHRFQIPTVLEFPMSAEGFLQSGSGLIYTLKFATPASTIESNLPQISNYNQFASGEAPRGPAPYLTQVKGPWGNMAVRVNLNPIDGEAQSPVPFLMDRKEMGQMGNLPLWKGIGGLQGDVGIYVDVSHVKKGVYYFNLDLNVVPEADVNLRDVFASPKAVWLKLPLR